MSPRWPHLVSLVALAGCNSTGVGNPAPASLALSIVSDDEQPHASDAGAASLPLGAVRNAVIVLGELRLLPCEPVNEATILTGPFVLDLIQGDTTPPIPPASVPPGGFCGIDATLAPAEAPPALLGRSVYFDGVRSDGTPFLVYTDMRATLRVRAPAGVAWNPKPSAVPHSVFWALRPKRWLEPAELDNAEPIDLPDGTRAVVISIDRHPLLFRGIRARLAGSSTLYDDTDDDDVFSAEDRSAIVGNGLTEAD